VSLTGALRLCAPAVGDGLISLEVFSYKDHAESWNDADGRTQDEVLAYLMANEITDDDLARTFGPQWSEIIDMIRRAAGFTRDELGKLNVAWPKWSAARHAAEKSAWSAAAESARESARPAARLAAGEAVREARSDAWSAAGEVRSAAAALVVRDLIGQHGFTQEHYDELTRQWRTVIGPLHPDDGADV